MELRDLAERLPPRIRDRARRIVLRSPTLCRLLLEPNEVRGRYDAWLRAGLERLPATASDAEASSGPVISVVMPVYNTKEPLLRAAIASVQRQSWPRWELCIADDASPLPHVRRVLEEAAAADTRIKVHFRTSNGHIAAASNTALSLAGGEWVALLDHDDLLPPHALAAVAAAALRHPTAALIFGDEDKIDEADGRSDPYFKAGFDPDLLLGQNLISHLGVYRRDLLQRIGGWRDGFEGSQDYDLALRAVAEAGSAAVIHVPGVLYHWRQASTGESFSQRALEQCAVSARRAVADHLRQRGFAGARVEPLARILSWNRVRWPLPEQPVPVTLVVMAGSDMGRSIAALQPLIEGTVHPVAEILVPLAADLAPTAPAPAVPSKTLVLPCGSGASWAQRVNRAVAAARGTVVILTGAEPALADPDWLDEVVSQLLRPDVAAVGGPVLTPRRRIRHAEFAFDPSGTVVPAYQGASSRAVGYSGALALVRRVGALSGGFMGVRRQVFLDAGGVDEALAAGLADVDLCLRLRQRGGAVLWTPHSPLIEASRPGLSGNRIALADEYTLLETRWGPALAQDPARSPLLTLHDGWPALPL